MGSDGVATRTGVIESLQINECIDAIALSFAIHESQNTALPYILYSPALYDSHTFTPKPL